MSKPIPLGGKNGQGKFAIVDDDLFEYLSQWSWHFNGEYAIRTYRTGKRTDSKMNRKLMHLEILEPPAGYEIDHIDLDKLNNRRENLRICTHSQNRANRDSSKTNGASQYKGVSLLKRNPSRPWMARIYLHRRQIFIGSFATEVEAAKAYDIKAKEIFGEFARPNFG